jgi:hypothetical protein
LLSLRPLDVLVGTVEQAISVPGGSESNRIKSLRNELTAVELSGVKLFDESLVSSHVLRPMPAGTEAQSVALLAEPAASWGRFYCQE